MDHSSVSLTEPHIFRTMVKFGAYYYGSFAKRRLAQRLIRKCRNVGNHPDRLFLVRMHSNREASGSGDITVFSLDSNTGALVGVGVRDYAVPTGNWVCSLYSCHETSFSVAKDVGPATAVGAGVDWLSPVISFRVVQFDWLHIHLRRDNSAFSPTQGQLPILGGWQDNYRFSTVIVFRFGENSRRR
jgi:hypothetical protein